MRIAAIIIAGGRSSRMGEEKAFTMLAGEPLLSHIVQRIAPQVTTVIVNANGDPSRFERFGLTVVPDDRSDIGTPLAGLHAALNWVRDKGFNAALTVPSDSPFLPRDLALKLIAANAHAAIAASGSQQHFLTGLWSHELLEKLEYAVNVEHVFRVKDWATCCSAVPVLWPDQPFDPFFNINTAVELARAARIKAEFDP